MTRLLQSTFPKPSVRQDRGLFVVRRIPFACAQQGRLFLLLRVGRRSLAIYALGFSGMRFLRHCVYQRAAFMLPVFPEVAVEPSLQELHGRVVAEGRGLPFWAVKDLDVCKRRRFLGISFSRLNRRLSSRRLKVPFPAVSRFCRAPLSLSSKNAAVKYPNGIFCASFWKDIPMLHWFI